MSETSFTPSPGHERPRVGVAALVRRDGRLLLLRRQGSHGAGSWSTPGGHLEFGESPEDCARRECLEETGVHMGPARLVAVTDDHYPESGKHYVTLWMQGDWLSGDGELTSPREADRVGWHAEDALPSPLFTSLDNLMSGRVVWSMRES